MVYYPPFFRGPLFQLLANKVFLESPELPGVNCFSSSKQGLFGKPRPLALTKNLL